jgi:outer membrane lipoprotein-sorting protein
MPLLPKSTALLFAALALVSAAPAPDTAPLEAWLERQAGIETLQAEFTQERTLPALKKPVSTPGTLALHRDGRLRWNLGDPPKTVAISDGESIQLIDVEKRRVHTVPADSPRARPFTLLGGETLGADLDEFLETFEAVESRVSRGIYQLTARPRDAALRRRIPWVFFDIDPADDTLRALEIQLADDSRIRTIFTDVRLNADLPDGLFDYDLEGFRGQP